MSRVLRAVLSALIALAIPLQGMAAVTMTLCPPAHHAGHSGADPAAAAHDGKATHPGAPEAQAAHHHGASSHGLASAQSTAQADSGEACAAGHSMLKCCSVACSMAALTTQSLAAAVRAHPPAPLQAALPFYRGVTPDGLDRPPKTVLA